MVSVGDTVKIIVDRESKSGNWIARQSSNFHILPSDKPLEPGQVWKAEVVRSDKFGGIIQARPYEFVEQKANYEKVRTDRRKKSKPRHKQAKAGDIKKSPKYTVTEKGGGDDRRWGSGSHDPRGTKNSLLRKGGH